jgi:hypothetical protein
MAERIQQADDGETRAIILTGVLSLFICIGISRFGYGVMIRSLLSEQVFSAYQTGLLASINLTGYLAGCIWYTFLPTPRDVLQALRLFVTGCVITLAALLVSDNFAWWSLMRFTNGLLSGAAFILTSVELVTALSNRDRLSYTPLLFSGVGLGICCSSISPVMGVTQSFNVITWMSLTCVLACIFLLNITSGMRTGQPEWRHDRKSLLIKPALAPLGIFLLSYGLEGAGYIIHATYIFSYSSASGNDSAVAVAGWISLGLGAAAGPALVWFLSRSISLTRIITGLYATQAIAIAVVIAGHGASSVVLSSFVFGASFMGVTSAYIYCAKMLWPQFLSGAAFLTVVYSIGQAVGPATGARLLSGNDISDAPFVLSMLIVGAAFTLFVLSSWLTPSLGHPQR